MPDKIINANWNFNCGLLYWEGTDLWKIMNKWAAAERLKNVDSYYEMTHNNETCDPSQLEKIINYFKELYEKVMK